MCQSACMESNKSSQERKKKKQQQNEERKRSGGSCAFGGFASWSSFLCLFWGLLARSVCVFVIDPASDWPLHEGRNRSPLWLDDDDDDDDDDD